MPQESIWLDFLNCLKFLDQLIPAAFPPELPKENHPKFWELATKLEMQERKSLSSKLKNLIQNQTGQDFTEAECWLSRRRFDWAGQLALVKAKEGVEPNVTLQELMVWALITTWESDGCISFWNHMERGGKPHPENPDGLTPI